MCRTFAKVLGEFSNILYAGGKTTGLLAMDGLTDSSLLVNINLKTTQALENADKRRYSGISAAKRC
jgi:hypothetical protein